MRYRQRPPAPELADLTNPRAQVYAGRVPLKPARPWFKKRRFILPLVLFVLMVMIQAAAGRGYLGTSEDGTNPQTAAAPSAKAAGIGVMVHDGMSEFLVTGVEHPGKSFQGKAGETLTAQGDFVIVRVNITNVGKEAKSPNCSCQRLFDDAGREFEPSPANLSTKDALKFVQLIDPQDTVTGVSMLFDVPLGATIVSIELHDSMESAGVKVSLI